MEEPLVEHSNSAFPEGQDTVISEAGPVCVEGQGVREWCFESPSSLWVDPGWLQWVQWLSAVTLPRVIKGIGEN